MKNESKKCSSCKKIKSKKDFYSRKNRLNGRPECKLCTSQKARDFYKKNPEVSKIRAKRWVKNNYKTKQSNQLKWRYGISLKEYNALVKSQKQKCKICKVKTKKTLNVDHCHKTNKIRGLLCSNCNTGIGLFKDNIIILKSAILYLKGEK